MNELETTLNNLSVDICVCTFRRAHVAETIRSIAGLFLPEGCVIRVIVVDNDAVQTALDIVEKMTLETGLNVTYIHAPAYNVSVARNAGLNASGAPLLAFIDDDETVSPGWLNAMLATLRETDADVVLGPVHALYEDAFPAWIRMGDFHSTYPVFVNGKIVTGYSGNVLMHRLSPAVDRLRFRPDLGVAGGEDTAFFSSIYQAGGRFAYASRATAWEVVPSSRATLIWLMRRYFRAGSTHGMLMKEAMGKNILKCLKHIFLALLKALFCLFMAIFSVMSFGRVAYWLLRGAMHTGVLSSLLWRRV